MKYSEAEPFLKQGMKVRMTVCSCCSSSIGQIATVKPSLQYDCKWIIEYKNTHHALDYNDKNEELEILENPGGSKWVHPEKIQKPKSATEVIMMNMVMDNIARMNHPPMFYGKSLGELLMERKSPKRKSYMSSIVEKIKNLKLSETDRILRKHGFEDESGKMTEEAENLMDEEILQERWLKRREEIATDIKSVEESDKK
jgi:hypothetical protein